MKSFITPSPLVSIKFSKPETADVYGCATWFPTCTKQRLTVYEDGLMKITRTVHELSRTKCRRKLYSVQPYNPHALPNNTEIV